MIKKYHLLGTGRRVFFVGIFEEKDIHICSCNFKGEKIQVSVTPSQEIILTVQWHFRDKAL